MSGSNPPSTSGSPCAARRALRTSAVALVGVALSVAMLAATSAFADSPTPIRHTQPVQARAIADAVPFRNAAPATPAALVTPTTVTPTTVAPPPPPAPVAPPAPAPRAVGDPNDPATWDRLAGCESGGNWAINTGNGYYGGLQFSLSSWRGVGGTGYPHEASREVQIEMGKRLYASGGWQHWPGCTRSFGWR